MDKWKNILDENILKYNVSFAAIFVLNYECLKDFIISKIRGFYSESGFDPLDFRMKVSKF